MEALLCPSPPLLLLLVLARLLDLRGDKEGVRSASGLVCTARCGVLPWSATLAHLHDNTPSTVLREQQQRIQTASRPCKRQCATLQVPCPSLTRYCVLTWSLGTPGRPLAAAAATASTAVPGPARTASATRYGRRRRRRCRCCRRCAAGRTLTPCRAIRWATRSPQR